MKEFLRADIDEQFIRAGDFKSIQSARLRILLNHIKKLITKPQTIEDPSESKPEIKTDIVLRDLMYILGVDDPVQSTMSLEYYLFFIG